ncbi:MAG: ABC transporter permease, partial [Muribaculaceae bacterium]|nr:ABC transporter permease [Muribaculaceae bacterium]
IILELVPSIGFLIALGAPDSMIGRIFIYMAQRLVIRGMVIGNIVALAVMIVQHMTHILPLDPESYYLSYVPIEFSWPLIIGLNISIFIIAWGMLLIPAHLIAGISPAKTMHYE